MIVLAAKFESVLDLLTSIEGPRALSYVPTHGASLNYCSCMSSLPVANSCPAEEVSRAPSLLMFW
jgi:hypothetical protein